MSDTPLQPKDLKKFAGQMVSAESPMFDLLPASATIVVGGQYRKATSNEEVPCHICNAPVFLDFRDRPAIGEEDLLIFLCPDCYFKMEPKEAQ